MSIAASVEKLYLSNFVRKYLIGDIGHLQNIAEMIFFSIDVTLRLPSNEFFIDKNTTIVSQKCFFNSKG